MNLYTQIIAEALHIDMTEAQTIQNFIEIYFDDFRWGSATESKIIKTAKQAQLMIDNPKYSELVASLSHFSSKCGQGIKVK